jgi:hypothetical protein
MLLNLAQKTVDHFASTHKKTDYFKDVYENGNNEGTSSKMSIGLFISIILWVILVLIIGKLLWNKVMCELFSFCKPMPNVLYLLGLIILLDIIRPSMM